MIQQSPARQEGWAVRFGETKNGREKSPCMKTGMLAASLVVLVTSLAIISSPSGVAEPPATAARPGVVSGPGLTLTDEQIERCVEFKKTAMQKLETDIATAKQRRREAASRRDRQGVKAAEEMEHDARAALSRASHKRPFDYWPDVEAADDGKLKRMPSDGPDFAAVLKAANDTPAAESRPGMTWVKGYTKKDGTKVNGYWRRK